MGYHFHLRKGNSSTYASESSRCSKGNLQKIRLHVYDTFYYVSFVESHPNSLSHSRSFSETKIRKCRQNTFFLVQLTPFIEEAKRNFVYAEIKRWKSLKHVKRNRKTRCGEVENNVFTSFFSLLSFHARVFQIEGKSFTFRFFSPVSNSVDFSSLTRC